MNKFIDGSLVYLRPFCQDDLEAWYQWFNCPDLTEHMNKGIFPNTRMQQEEHYKSLTKSNNDLQLAIILKKDDSLIGTVDIHNIDWVHRRGDVSIFVANKQNWGEGIATEAISLIAGHAFDKMNLRKLTAGMVANNIGSKRCFEKNGFVVEGKIRESYFLNGTYVDEYRLGLLRKEWVRAHGNSGKEV